MSVKNYENRLTYIKIKSEQKVGPFYRDSVHWSFHLTSLFLSELIHVRCGARRNISGELVQHVSTGITPLCDPTKPLQEFTQYNTKARRKYLRFL